MVRIAKILIIQIDFEATITNTDIIALDLVTSFHTNSVVVRDLNAVAKFLIKLDPVEKAINIEELRMSIRTLFELVKNTVQRPCGKRSTPPPSSASRPKPSMTISTSPARPSTRWETCCPSATTRRSWPSSSEVRRSCWAAETTRYVEGTGGVPRSALGSGRQQRLSTDSDRRSRWKGRRAGAGAWA